MFSIPCKDQNTNSHFNTLMLREKITLTDVVAVELDPVFIQV